MDAFARDGVVPDVLDSIPPNCLGVKYNDTELVPGNQSTPTQVKGYPMIEYEVQPEGVYTLILSGKIPWATKLEVPECEDPDAPSRADPKFKELLHWLVVNIAGNDITTDEEKVQYIASGAPKGTSLHRYVLQLYRQPKGKIDFTDVVSVSNISAQGRRSFNSKEFASKYDLKLEAGNFFNAEWDDYVPTLHAQLGFTPLPSK